MMYNIRLRLFTNYNCFDTVEIRNKTAMLLVKNIGYAYYNDWNSDDVMKLICNELVRLLRLI